MTTFLSSDILYITWNKCLKFDVAGGVAWRHWQSSLSLKKIKKLEIVWQPVWVIIFCASPCETNILSSYLELDVSGSKTPLEAILGRNQKWQYQFHQLGKCVWLWSLGLTSTHETKSSGMNGHNSWTKRSRRSCANNFSTIMCVFIYI